MKKITAKDKLRNHYAQELEKLFIKGIETCPKGENIPLIDVLDAFIEAQLLANCVAAGRLSHIYDLDKLKLRGLMHGLFKTMHEKVDEKKEALIAATLKQYHPQGDENVIIRA